MMRKITTPIAFFGAMSLVSPAIVYAQDKQNPLIETVSTPYAVPAFDKIKNEHFIPAFEEGMRQQNQVIAQILSNTAPADFKNTIAALESSDALLNEVSAVFFNLNGANTNPEIQKIAEQLSPKLSQHNDDIYLNAALFDRVKKVYDQRNALGLNPEKDRILEKTYKAFVRSGAQLTDAQQKKMRAINSKLSLASLKFGRNILDETNKYELLITEEKNLAGLPESVRAAAAESAAKAGKKGWRFTLHNPSVMPFLQYADNRELRKQIYAAYTERGNHNDELDNKALVAELAHLRAQKAQLLGYASHADFVLEESMSKNPATVNKLLENLWKYALPKAKEERTLMQEVMNRDYDDQQLAAWDWSYYANKVKEEKYSYVAEELRPYFELNKVRDGIFVLVKKLYGIEFSRLNNVPVYHEDAAAYEVKDKNGKLVGVMYMDFFPRSSKRGGAWMTSFRKQYYEAGKRVPPVVSIVCNFSAPVGDEPALLTPDEVETFFHEFGHALHGLLSDVEYQMLAGTSVPRDFVELPSQIMEHWAFEPEMLQLYAHHYQTGEVIPQELVKKMEDAAKFNQGFATVEYLAASMLDMAYHTTGADQKIEDVTAFEKEKMDKIGLIDEIAPRYRSTYFNHVFSGGYSSGYYSYIWSEVLDSDAFAYFKESGDIFNSEIASAFQKEILSKGGTVDPDQLYLNFRGRQPDMKYLLQNRGLLAEPKEAEKQPSNIQLPKD